MTRPWPEGLRWREIRSVGHFVVVEPDSSRGFVAYGGYWREGSLERSGFESRPFGVDHWAEHPLLDELRFHGPFVSPGEAGTAARQVGVVLE